MFIIELQLYWSSGNSFNRLIMDAFKLFNQLVNYALPMTKGLLEADLRNVIFDAINSHLS